MKLSRNGAMCTVMGDGRMGADFGRALPPTISLERSVEIILVFVIKTKTI